MDKLFKTILGGYKGSLKLATRLTDKIKNLTPGDYSEHLDALLEKGKLGSYYLEIHEDDQRKIYKFDRQAEADIARMVYKLLTNKEATVYVLEKK